MVRKIIPTYYAVGHFSDMIKKKEQLLQSTTFTTDANL